ncbi:MAG TPA: hypothetical protein VGM03_05735 [Phycisphaerae bacterium]
MSVTRCLVFALGLIAVSVCGCKTDALFEPSHKMEGPTTRIDAPQGIDVPDINVVDRTEVDLVEEMATHRAMYHRTLRVLRDYYKDHGYEQKAKWAEFELADLNHVKPFKYIMSAEIPSDALRPNESIAEADVLFDRGMDLLKKGGHGVPVFYRESTMKDALKAFIELVQRYPSSDKIDDAAFYIGEIYKEYFKDQETIAVQWYERALKWNSKTPHQVRFQLAVVYDFRLHDRAKALEYYHRVMDEEADLDRSNVAFSVRRIEELTKPREGAEVHASAPGAAPAPERRAALAGDGSQKNLP